MVHAGVQKGPQHDLIARSVLFKGLHHDEMDTEMDSPQFKGAET
jgi:hypothetical protein